MNALYQIQALPVVVKSFVWLVVQVLFLKSDLWKFVCRTKLYGKHRCDY